MGYRMAPKAPGPDRPPDPLVWLPLRLSRQTAGIRLLRAPEPTP